MTSNVVLFPILAILGAVPLFLLIAAVMRVSLAQAKEVTLKFLEDWANIAPTVIKGAVSAVLGFAGGFALLTGLAYGFNRLGDETMPFISKKANHLNNGIVAWSVEQERDWKGFRDKYRNQWEKEHPGQFWENQKVEKLDKWQVRTARTLFYFSLLLPIAGLIDITFLTYRKRGSVVLILGIVITAACLSYWVGRKEHYVLEVIRQNEQLAQPVPKPQSLKALLNES